MVAAALQILFYEGEHQIENYLELLTQLRQVLAHNEESLLSNSKTNIHIYLLDLVFCPLLPWNRDISLKKICFFRKAP
jgi:hypothetical protein